MPDLDQVVQTQTPVIGNDRQIVEGVLSKRNDRYWVRVDSQAQLWGPVYGGSDDFVGKRVCVAISQKSAPFIVWPTVPGDSSGGGSGQASAIWNWTTATSSAASGRVGVNAGTWAA